MKFKLDTYNDGTPASPEDRKLFFALSVTQVAAIFGGLAGVVAAIVTIAS